MSDTIDGAKPDLQFQVSPLLLGSVIAGIASTVAVVAFAVLSDRPGGGPGPGGQPPPPPGTAGLTISVGLAVVCWLAVIVALARDQVLRRMAALRAELISVADEYGERRETDGYLRAMRVAGPGLPARCARCTGYRRRNDRQLAARPLERAAPRLRPAHHRHRMT